MKRWIRRIGLAALALVIIGGSGGYLWLRTSLPQISGTIRVAGLSGLVEIIRDREGIPHIRAKSAKDAYFALGFVHAQDRLFQMDFMRRLGAGRLSEVMGDPTIRIDKLMRTLGLYRLAEESARRMSADSRAALDAYTSGVNAYMDSRAGLLPIEFVFLWYTPKRWRPADSLVWGRMMAFRLTGNWGDEALRARLTGKLPAERIEELWPEYDGKAPATLPAARAADNSEIRHHFARLMDDFPDAMRRVTASNSWLLSGKHTQSGKPILANDPHLGFQAPNLWYLARMEAPGLSLTGATVPGVPYHVLGHNGKAAWAFTTTESDTQDLYLERLTEGSTDTYDTPDGPKPFTVREEVIQVSGGEPVRLKVRSTRHGPVVSDLDKDLRATAGNKHVVALAATALRPEDRTAEAIHGFGRAQDWPAFREAARLFHAPQQNISYADTEGNVGFIAPALVPLRKNGNGIAPSPGWTDDHEWNGFIPFEQLPQAFNPESGRIVNANHRVAPKGYPYYLGHIRTPPYRAERIHRVLDSAPGNGGKHALEGFAGLQKDALSLTFIDLKPLMMIRAPRNQTALKAYELLSKWDGRMDRDRPEPLIFVAWLRAFNRQLYEDELGEAFSAYWGLHPAFVRRALTDRGHWCDDTKTPKKQSCEIVLERSLEMAVAELAEEYGDDPTSWRWGQAHYARFRHILFGWIPVLNRIFDIVIPSDGGAFTVNRAQMRIGDKRRPFASVHGPGYRAVYDLSDLDKSLFMQATGQSGNFLSPLYDNLTERWRDGKYLTIPRSRQAAMAGARGVLKLAPR